MEYFYVSHTSMGDWGTEKTPKLCEEDDRNDHLWSNYYVQAQDLI